MRRSIAGLVLLAVAATAHAQDVATEVAVDEAAPGIFLLNGANGFSSNMALMVGAEHVLLIDDGMAPITADLMATIVELAGRRADFVVFTGAGKRETLRRLAAIVRLMETRQGRRWPPRPQPRAGQSTPRGR